MVKKEGPGCKAKWQNVRQTLSLECESVWVALNMRSVTFKNVKPTKSHMTLPIGPTARIAFEIDATRAACSKAAQAFLRQEPVNEAELEECICLDEALGRAH